MTPDQVTRNEFLTNLGTDYVAVSANGTPIARADTLDGARRAVAGFDPAIPDDAFFTGADFGIVGKAWSPSAPVSADINWLSQPLDPNGQPGSSAAPPVGKPDNWMAKPV